MPVTAKVMPIFYPNSKLIILTLHFTTNYLLVVLFNVKKLYGASDRAADGGAPEQLQMMMMMMVMVMMIVS